MTDATTSTTSPTLPTPPIRLQNNHRVHNSCDRCRSRKTKCIDPVPGPCRYCARTGATCRIATPRRKRPYYHVTEEEYQCSLRILEHFFPDKELNLQSLRAIARDIVNGTLNSAPPQQNQTLQTQDHVSSEEEECPKEMEPVVESLNDLHEPLGCMMKDSRGRYRYIGAHSDIPFNASVCSIADDSSQKSSAIITPPKVGSFPPAFPESPESLHLPNQDDSTYLPPRKACDYYVSRFLEEVHCTHWFYSVETFHSRVENTYTSSVSTRTSSWLCSLYAIFAIGAADPQRDENSHKVASLNRPHDQKTSSDYIALAKRLIPAVYEEADIDSIRALAILSIAFENHCSRVTSYLYMGASIQMAYSLGLHRDQLPESGRSMEREQNRRVWYTLYTLDHEIASRGGSPNLIDERMLKIETTFPSEQMLYPGMHTPVSWLSTYVSLCRLKREIIQAVYPERSSNSKTISFSVVSNLLLSLQKWLQLLEPHLKYDVPAPPSQKRAIAVLHLHYWSSIILLCRPFLLYLVLKHSALDSTKKTWFERMSKSGIDAAQKSLSILQRMATDNNLSSLTAFDSTCILRGIMIFILAFAHTKMQHYRSKIETSLKLLQGMEQVGFCRTVTEETPLRLTDLGLLEDDKARNAAVLLDDDLIAQLWGNFDPNFMTPLQTEESLDLAFDDSSSFDLDSEIFHVTNLDESITINPSEAYSSFDFRGAAQSISALQNESMKLVSGCNEV